MCRAAFAGSPLLRAVNHYKQFEIKNLSLYFPLAPLIAQFGTDVIHSKEKGIWARVKDAAKQLTRDQVVALGLVVGFGLTNRMYAPLLGLTSEAFDSSGHLMLKVLLANLLSANLDAIAQIRSPENLFKQLSQESLQNLRETAKKNRAITTDAQADEAIKKTISITSPLNTQSVLIRAASVLYAMTDAVMIHNTVKACHSVAESVLGLAWGAGIVATR